MFTGTNVSFSVMYTYINLRLESPGLKRKYSLYSSIFKIDITNDLIMSVLGLSFTYALKIILSLTVNLFSLFIIIIYQDDIALFSEWSDGSMFDSISHIYVKITVLCAWTCPDTIRNYQYIFIFVGQMIMPYILLTVLMRYVNVQ